MVKAKRLGWIFSTDGVDGIPYFKCPYCSRVISGIKVKFSDVPMNKCPECSRIVHFDNVKEEDWLYIDQYYGRDE